MAIGQTREAALWNGFLLLVMGCTVTVHLCLLSPGVDAGLHLYGSFLLTKGLLPYRHLWNNKPFLIYLIGMPGFLLKGHPFIGERILELGGYGFNLWMLRRALHALGIFKAAPYLLSFSLLYLLSWDQGFLTETFVIPLTLLGAWGLASRSRYFSYWGGLLLTAAFMLKQNGGLVIGCLLLIDIFSAYRGGFTPVKKLLSHGLVALCCAALAWGIIYNLGIGQEYLDQVFAYNSEYVQRPGLLKWLFIQVKGNSFVSWHGVSAILLLNGWAVFAAAGGARRAVRGSQRSVNGEKSATRGRGPAAIMEVLVTVSALVYLACYYGTYLSGKTYAHYFLLLIVPATILLGYAVERFAMAKVLAGAALLFALYTNFSAIPSNRQIGRERAEVAARIRETTSKGDRIHLAGFGNQYIYVMADRLSHTRFLLPLLENNGYSASYRQILDSDFTLHPPAYLLLNKNNYKGLDPSNYYTEIVDSTLKNYRLVMENNLLQLYRRQP